MRIVTTSYRTPAHRYMRSVAEEWLGAWWWALALPVAACLSVGAVINVTFTFVAMMLIFLVAPLIMLFLYYNYALTPEAIMAVRPHEVTIDREQGIDVSFEPHPESGRTYPPVHIGWGDVHDVEYNPTEIIVKLHRSGYRLLIIPYEALASEQDRQTLNSLLCHV